ncbi:NADH oxidase [Azospirillum sp. TSO22-1]|uniref:oxidoreductase n=1 Tax=Azospirillum sp. TSO22-1 TaxID=716789 RepID=UPI000D61E19D|nr:NADH oxidase [Azospirillum sp. TSO22-1]PWC37269.1 NADH oxidase [Azospirillum sp. TSO22-1]
MWRPPQRIEHRPTPGRWPDAAEASSSHLFQPVGLGPVTLAQRTWVPAMVPWRATDEGFVSDGVLDWYRRFAEGRPGAIVVEATGIRDVPSGPLLRIGHDRFLLGLAKLVETVREASGGETRLFIQIIDFLTIRRRPTREAFFGRFLAVTDRHREALGVSDEAEVRRRLLEMPAEEADAILEDRECESLAMGYRERVTDTHLPHIADLPRVLPDLFADAAARARDVGFDGVELHYAHAYTMASFLSERNDRADGYGGARENRVRLPLEVYGRVRERVGPGFAVGCRFLAEECIAGGGTVQDAAYFAVEFARAGMDFLSTSRGGKFDDAAQPRVGEAAYPYTGPSGYECMPQHISDELGPFGRNVAPTARIRRAVRDAGFATPVVVTGGIHNFEQAEGILARGEADLIGMARQSLADPDWFRKVRLGRGTEVRLCEYSNYCEGLDQKHKPVTCKLWDRAGGQKRMVAPGWEAQGKEKD